MGWFVPQVLGVGYGFVGDALNGNMAFKMMLLLVVLNLSPSPPVMLRGTRAVSSVHRFLSVRC